MIFKSMSKTQMPLGDGWYLESARAIASYNSSDNYRVAEKEAHRDNNVKTKVVRLGINGAFKRGDNSIIKVTDGTIVDCKSSKVYSKGDLVSMEDWESDMIIAPLGAKMIAYEPDNEVVAKAITQRKEYAPSSMKVSYAMSVLSKLTLT